MISARQSSKNPMASVRGCRRAWILDYQSAKAGPDQHHDDLYGCFNGTEREEYGIADAPPPILEFYLSRVAPLAAIERRVSRF